MADLRQALKLEPNQPEALGLMGWFLLREQKFAESIAAFDTALAKGPAKSLDLRRGRAIALFKSGKTSKAQTEIAAIGAESEEPAELNSLCWEMAKAGVMLETALANCHEAVRLRPDAAGYRDSLGMALLRLGKLEESIAAYSKAIEKAHFAPSYMGRAIAYARKGDMNHARADRAEALKRDADVEAQFANYGLAIDQSQNSRVSR
jgi:tetratricopeptide (TPR) repeat protein